MCWEGPWNTGKDVISWLVHLTRGCVQTPDLCFCTASLHLLEISVIRGASRIPSMDSFESWQFKEHQLNFSSSIFFEGSTTLLKSESSNDLGPNSQIHIIFSTPLALLDLESSPSSSNHDPNLVLTELFPLLPA